MIQQLGNAFITLMLARFILNDMPHSVGLLASPGERRPTIGQIRYIAVLTQRLHMVEIRVESFGEAGRLIRELEEEDKYRKGLAKGKSNPGVYVITNEEVSSGRVSGVAVAWVGSKDVGSLHYDLGVDSTGELSFMQVDAEYRSLGVGERLYRAVEELAKSHGVRSLSVEVGIPGYGDVEGAKRFWKKVGFTVVDDHAEKRLKGGNPGRLSEAGFKALPVAYRGFDPEKPEPVVIHVTPDENIAKSHGRYVMTGRVLPDKLIPDPEVEGFEARKLTGIESFNLGSARIPARYYYPDDYRKYLEVQYG